MSAWKAWLIGGFVVYGLFKISFGSGGEVEKPMEKNEDLVMELIFDRCLAAIRKGSAPFEGLATGSASRDSRFVAARAVSGEVVEVISPRYVGRWTLGEDGRRICGVERAGLTAEEKEAHPARLVVEDEGFLARLDEKARAEGFLTERIAARVSGSAPGFWSSEAPNRWRAWGPRGGDPWMAISLYGRPETDGRGGAEIDMFRIVLSEGEAAPPAP
ncbi:hypothetical protein [Neomegalonema sp.]|uniref:hypothetical protein n=1 Tax=Neomegalonema sp. TaxID=2039713 RepID=UPI002623F1E1|nr:hypothetical protein [Neomegalonema sp.]MDD2869049.1 hypothetical protein [Neomegalonema sp.]